MKYRDIIGYTKPKKKVVKEQIKPTKPKVNKVLKDVKQELNESEVALGIQTLKDNPPFQTPKQLKEVGAGTEYRPHIHKIDKLYHDYWDAVKDFTDLLLKKGVKKEANLLHKLYMKLVHTFHKKHFIKMIKKLM
tara:strand:- start:92 stop:493 length:402 start_codon:yes stop_codon:yes gene_type:complete